MLFSSSLLAEKWHVIKHVIEHVIIILVVFVGKLPYLVHVITNIMYDGVFYCC